jgi:hypothetical protein
VSTHPDAKRSRLRALTAEMDIALAGTEAAPVRDAWQRLVAALDLGTEPVVRACPRCGELGMGAATRCGHCWSALAPA